VCDGFVGSRITVLMMGGVEHVNTFYTSVLYYEITRFKFLYTATSHNNQVTPSLYTEALDCQLKEGCR
jgi:hypothetical protein